MQTPNQPTRWAVLEELERVQVSSFFAGSDRLKTFLRFVVEETLAGRGSALKEAVIGNAIYERAPPYDPRIDSTVRVEARRLRRQLKAYYAGPGLSSTVRITLPTGAYVPAFDYIQSEEGDREAGDFNGGTFREGSGAALAIMPFRAVSGRAEDQAFADELADEIMYTMNRAPGYRIVSRLTSFHYDDRVSAVAQIANELSVDGVLIGSVLGQGNTLRVTIELADPQGFVLWSDRFQGDAADKEGLQQRVALTLLSRARLDHSPMRERVESPTPAALQANAQVYQGRRLLDQQTPKSVREARRLFTRVAAVAPDYSRGYNGMAEAACDLYRMGLCDSKTALQDASDAIRRALEIDSNSVEALTARGTVAAWIERDWDGAERWFRAALARGETGRTFRVYAIVLAYLRRNAEAEGMFDEARHIEPISAQQMTLQATWQYLRRTPTADWIMLPDNPPTFEAQAFRALSLTFEGDRDAALALLPELEGRASDYPNFFYVVLEIRARLGDGEVAASAAGRPDRNCSYFALASLAAALNDHDGAIRHLESSIAALEFAPLWLRDDRRFDALRGHPSFIRLLTR